MVQVQNLTFSYNKKQTLFNQLQLFLPPGNIYGLLGKNGAGKTTLLKIISGLLFPAQGTVDVVGYKPANRYPQFMREIYLVTEEFELPKLTLQQYVKLYSPFYPRFNKKAFREYINEFNLPVGQKLTDMSYGQKKIFLLSFGLATDCKLLLLDEPTNGLDIPSKSLFRKIVASAIHEDRSFVISTHQVRDMENLIDPIIILDEGSIIFQESCERIAQKITIHKQPKLPADGSVVYSETGLGSYTVVQQNKGKEETSINLEILFNAVVSSTQQISEIFKN